MFSREIELIRYIKKEGGNKREKKRKRETDFKELAQGILGASKSKICKAGQCAGDSGKSLIAVWSPKSVQWAGGLETYIGFLLL